MKKILSAMVCVLMTVASWAYDVEINGICYDLDDEKKEATVTVNQNYSGDIVIPEKILASEVEYTVTSIGTYAFAHREITSVVIPKTVKTIDETAFYYCLTLTNVNIPESVETIGNSAFRCTGITSVVIPNSVKYIGDWAFATNYITEITIGNSVEYIGTRAFAFNDYLKAINIPKSVTKIGDYLLGSDKEVASITVEEGNSVYDSRENCNAIIETATNTLIEGCMNTVIPNTVSSIGYMAFCARTTLTSIAIPESVKSIGDYAFSMTALKTIDIPNSVVKIGANAFDQCRVLESINIPESVEEIGEYAFNGCWSLSSLTIPSNITSIEDGTFRECEKLETIKIPEKVTHIGNFAFRNCKSLVRLTIPGNVESTGEFVFRLCDRLTDITCLATNPPTAKGFGFQYGMMKTPTLHVLPGCKEAYENAMYWQDLTIVDDAVAPTGINATSATTKDAKIFSISGQRLPAPQKGINVVNGRKVMY